jgi:HlyD family secretion protein
VRQGDLVATIRVIPSTAGLSAAEARLARAKVEVANTEREHDRIQRLFGQGIASETDWRRAEIERDRSREELRAAEDNLDVIRKGSTRYAGDTGNTLVRSTIAGTVLEVPVEEGNSVIEANTFNAGTTIATVADMSELIFLGKVDESEVGKLRPGMDLELTIGAVESKKLRASLERIAPKGKEENGAIQFEIRAALAPEPDTTVRANYSANADIVLDRREQVLALDEGLLQFEGDKVFVEVMTAPQVFERREVKTGLSDGLSIEILGGLAADDQVKSRPAGQDAPRRS